MRDPRSERRLSLDSTICSKCSRPIPMKEDKALQCHCGFVLCHHCATTIHERNACPRCHQVYSQNPTAEPPGLNMERAPTPTKRKLTNRNRQSLQDMRIIQYNLVYVIGLPSQLTDERILSKSELFGKYGTIRKIIVCDSRQSHEAGKSHCAYITYESSKEALACILEMDGAGLGGSVIHASFGTTKYCSFFLRGVHCHNAECLYLHYMADPEDCFTKTEMQTRQLEFYTKTHPTKQEPSSVKRLLPKQRCPTVFGVTHTDYSDLLGDQKPIFTQEGVIDFDSCARTLAAMIAREHIACLSCSSQLDPDFLLKADDFILSDRKSVV